MNHAKRAGGAYSEWLDAVADDPPEAPGGSGASGGTTTAPLPRAGARVTTEPYPLVQAPGAPAGELEAVEEAPPSGARALVEMQDDPHTDAILNQLSYPRPLEPVAKSATDGDLSAAHAAGPVALPLGVKTPPLQPAVVVTDSVVRGHPAAATREERDAQTVIVRKRGLRSPVPARTGDEATPPAAAKRHSRSPGSLIALAGAIAVVLVVAGLAAAGFFRSPIAGVAPVGGPAVPAPSPAAPADSSGRERIAITPPPAPSLAPSPPPSPARAAAATDAAPKDGDARPTRAIKLRARPSPAASGPPAKPPAVPDPNEDRELLIGN